MKSQSKCELANKHVNTDMGVLCGKGKRDHLWMDFLRQLASEWSAEKWINILQVGTCIVMQQLTHCLGCPRSHIRVPV